MDGARTGEGHGVGAGPPATTGRGTGMAIAVGLPLVLLVAWGLQLSAVRASDFGPAEQVHREVGLLIALLAGAALAVGVPTAVLVRQVRLRRRDPRHSRAAFVAAVVVLVVGAATSGVAALAQVPAAIGELYQQAQPPTAAEARSTGQEAHDDMRRIGDGTVRALGGDPGVGRSSQGSSGPVWSEPCRLANDDPGVSWRYSWSADSRVDAEGAPLLPEGVEVLPGTREDLDGVREFWASEGIEAEQDTVAVDQVVPVADWLERWSYVRAGPTVRLEGICTAA